MHGLDLDLDLENVPRSNVRMQMETPSVTFYLLAIEMFFLSVIVCVIILYDLANMYEIRIYSLANEGQRL